MDSSVVYGNNGGGSRLVVTELSHIKQLVAQLEVHLGGESPDLCKSLASQIFSLTERSIGIITSSNHFNGGGGGGGNKRSAGLASATPSPLSDVVDAPFKTNKKRKSMEKRTHQVRVTSGSEAATPVDDGHSWRKYGQKEILGAKHPRSYYRCTHRHSQGCMATKQVQRTDEDLTLFDVIYLGTHSCVHKMAAVAAGRATEPPSGHNPNAHGLLQSLSASLTVKTEGLAVTAAAEQQGWSATAPFGVTSSTPASACLASDRSPFSAPSTTSENWGVSPATSDSNHVFSFPPAEWRDQYELQEVMSALLSASTPPAPAVDDFHDFDISSFFV